MRRKVFTITLAFICGIIIWLFKSIYVFVLVILIGALFLYVGSNEHDYKRTTTIILLIFFSVIGMFRTSIEDWSTEKYIICQPVKGTICAKVLNITEKDIKKNKILCQIETLDGKKYSGKILLSYYSQIKQSYKLYGKTISFYSQIENPKENGNPRTFNYKTYLKSQDIYLISTISSYDVLNKDISFLDKIKSFIIKQREVFIESLSCSDQTKGFIRGIIFGDKSQMDEDIYEDFKNNGTAHILAVSGLHVGILFGIYKTINKKRKSRFITIIFLLSLLGYGTLTLWSISVTRAICLVFLITMGDILNRRYDLLTALAVICICVLMKNPFMVLNTGFQMSFLAVLSIGVLGPPINRKLSKGLGTVIAVQIGMIPYTAYVFNYIPLLGIICNIPIIFLTSLVVPIGLAAFIISSILNIELISMILSATADLLITINHVLSKGGVFSMDVVSPKLFVIIAFYLVVFYLFSEDCYVKVHRKDYKGLLKMVSILLISTLICVEIGSSPFDEAFAVFVDVGQGDSVHLKAGETTDLLFDGGGNINYNVGKNTLKPYLLKNGVSNIDLACATHLHTDHFKGLEELSSCYFVNQNLIKGRAGDVVKVNDKTYFEIIWPIEFNPDTEDENLNSLIFKLHYNDHTILITGDITEAGEKALIEYYKGTDTLESDVLKIAHHGSKYSTCNEFLNAVNPRIAVISVGKNNYGHPSNEVIEKLNKKGIMLFRTDQCGAVGLIDNKGEINICTENQK